MKPIAEHKIPRDWVILGREIENYQGRFLVFVLGENDTGKSSLCRYLVSYLQGQGRRLAWIDADLGQSHLGPPTSVGMTLLPPPGKGEGPLWIRFVGSTSPVGHLIQSLVAVRIMVDKAIQLKVDGIILDTCGYVSGRVAAEFKFQKIELVKPTHLIALERRKELAVLLKNFSARRSLLLRRFSVPEYIPYKSRVQRAEYRRERFKKYFQESAAINFMFRGMGLHGHIPSFRNLGDWTGLLIGFCDEMNDTMALGIVQEVDLQQKQVSCLTPLRSIEKVRSIQFGSLYLDQSGQEFSRSAFHNRTLKGC